VLTPSDNTDLAFKLDQVISTYVDHALVEGADSKFTSRNEIPEFDFVGIVIINAI
jgi:hypothetical protein